MIKLNKVVLLEEEIVYVRAARRDGRRHYDSGLQDLFLIDGLVALRSAAMRHYHGFVLVRGKQQVH